MKKRPHRLLSHRAPSQNLQASHIIESSLDRSHNLIEKYQTEVQQAIDTIDRRRAPSQLKDRQANPVNPTNPTNPNSHHYSPSYSNLPSKELQKLILGLEYALQTEKKRRSSLQNGTASLQSQLSNLRNLLAGPDERFQKTVLKECQQKVTSLEARLLEQKQHYEFILESKNESIVNLQMQLNALREGQLPKRLIDLTHLTDQLRNSLIRKSISIQRMIWHPEQDEQDHQRTKIDLYAQLQVSNQLILRKNIELLSLNEKTRKLEAVLQLIQDYLDKKQTKGDVEHSSISKLRVFLREKAIFERELLQQLNQHSKRIASFEGEVLNKDSLSKKQFQEMHSDNKRLANLVSTLQTTIKNLQLELDEQKRNNGLLMTQTEIAKREFVEEVKRIKGQLQGISSVTRSEFDKMKIENMKLAEQNKSLLYLLGKGEGGREKGIIKVEAKKEKYMEKDIEKDKHVETISEHSEHSEFGAKLQIVSTFSAWLLEWNRLRNWDNRRILLNLLLDREQLRMDSLSSLTYVINLLHECFFQSKNSDVQDRGILLLRYYIRSNILPQLHLDRLLPIVIRGMRGVGQLSVAAAEILSSCVSLQKWTSEMSNEMLGSHGLKYLFQTVQSSSNQHHVSDAFQCLIYCCPMMLAYVIIYFIQMHSYDVTTIILTLLSSTYVFLLNALQFLLTLLSHPDFLKSTKSLLQFRRLFMFLKSKSEKEVRFVVSCLLILNQNRVFIKSVNKLESLSLLSQCLKQSTDYALLKDLGVVYCGLIAELESENIGVYCENYLDRLLQILGNKQFADNRFNRSLRVLENVTVSIAESKMLDQRVFTGVMGLYSQYDELSSGTRLHLNSLVNTIYQRNKEIVTRFTNEKYIVALVQCYKGASVSQECIFLLRILLFQQEQKRSTQVMRAGREGFLSMYLCYVDKLLGDSLSMDYQLCVLALRNMLGLMKEKYIQKYINRVFLGRLIQKIFNSRSEEQYIGLALSVIYFLCKHPQISEMSLDCGIIEQICAVLQDKRDSVIVKALSVLELIHSMNYKLKVLNVLLREGKMTTLKAINVALIRAKNKGEMGARGVFIYDHLIANAESMALQTENNGWMVRNLVEVRNQYVGKVDSLVYKVELLLHHMSEKSGRVKSLYQQFKVEGDSEEDQDK